MKKIKIKVKINDYNIKDIGILDKDIIKLTQDDTSFEFDTKTKTLTRENKEMKQIIDFKNKYFIYTLKEIKQEIKEKIKVNLLTEKDKEYNINYQIEENKFYLNIEYETI